MDTFLLKSKTVIMVLIGTAPQILPQFGWSFTVDDAAFFTSQIDAVWAGLFAVLAIWGRKVAKGPLRMTPNL